MNTSEQKVMLITCIFFKFRRACKPESVMGVEARPRWVRFVSFPMCCIPLSVIPSLYQKNKQTKGKKKKKKKNKKIKQVKRGKIDTFAPPKI